MNVRKIGPNVRWPVSATTNLRLTTQTPESRHKLPNHDTASPIHDTNYQTLRHKPPNHDTNLQSTTQRVRCFIHRLISPMHQTGIRVFKSDASVKSTGE